MTWRIYINCANVVRFVNCLPASLEHRRLKQGGYVSAKPKSVMNFWPAASEHPRITQRKFKSTTPMLVVTFGLLLGRLISTLSTLLVNIWPAIWKIYINLANVGCEFWPAGWRINIHLAKSDRRFLTCRLEDQNQLRQRWTWIFDLPPDGISGWQLEDLYQLRYHWLWIFHLPPGRFMSTSPTLIVNFWPAATNHRWMIQRRCTLTLPTLVVNFLPVTWSIYINFAKGGRKSPTCRSPRTRSAASRKQRMIYQLHQLWS